MPVAAAAAISGPASAPGSRSAVAKPAAVDDQQKDELRSPAHVRISPLPFHGLAGSVGLPAVLRGFLTQSLRQKAGYAKAGRRSGNAFSAWKSALLCGTCRTVATGPSRITDRHRARAQDAANDRDLVLGQTVVERQRDRPPAHRLRHGEIAAGVPVLGRDEGLQMHRREVVAHLNALAVHLLQDAVPLLESVGFGQLDHEDEPAWSRTPARPAAR